MLLFRLAVLSKRRSLSSSPARRGCSSGSSKTEGIVEKAEGNSEFIIQNSPTYHIRHTAYETLTTCFFNNITAFYA